MSMTPTLPERCGHVAPMALERLEGGYVARCLRCGTVGPVRDTFTEARRTLFFVVSSAARANPTDIGWA